MNAIDFPSGENAGSISSRTEANSFSAGGEFFWRIRSSGKRQILASRFCTTYASRAPLDGIVIRPEAPSKAKGASAPRPSIVTCLSSPVLIAPPPYTMVRLSGFHANVVIGTDAADGRQEGCCLTHEVVAARGCLAHGAPPCFRCGN
jgi:hypothetical protein